VVRRVEPAVAVRACEDGEPAGRDEASDLGNVTDDFSSS
jgi:hypothetical protein